MDQVGRGVPVERRIEEQAVLLAVFRQVHEAGVDAAARRAVRKLDAVECDRAAALAAQAEQGFGEFGAAGADDAGKAQHFAGAHIKADIAKPFAAQLAHREAHGAVVAAGLRGDDRRGARGDAAHRVDDLGVAVAIERAAQDHRAVAQHADRAADLADLAQLVRDEEDADALGLQLADALEEGVHLEGRQRRGRLVEDQHARFADQAAQDLDDLALGDFQCRRLRVEVEGDGEFGDQLLDPLAQRARRRAQAEADVLQHRLVAEDVRFLRHQIEAELLRQRRRGMGELLAVDLDRAGIGRHEAGHDLHQGGLAGAVAAEQRMHLALLQGERNPLQDRNGTVGFPYAGELCSPPGRCVRSHSAPVQMSLVAFK